MKLKIGSPKAARPCERQVAEMNPELIADEFDALLEVRLRGRRCVWRDLWPPLTGHAEDDKLDKS